MDLDKSSVFSVLRFYLVSVTVLSGYADKMVNTPQSLLQGNLLGGAVNAGEFKRTCI